MSHPTPSLPKKFQFAGIHCGLKTDPEKRDLALFVSERPCSAAGVFTQNQVCGAPVKVSRERVPSEEVRAVVINSGNANASTGAQGLLDAQIMTQDVADAIECDAESVLVCSTGVIGIHLPDMSVIRNGIQTVTKKLNATTECLEQAARGMMTTDTFPKIVSRKIVLGENEITITGVAKGAAMIAPNMATMLSVIMTDASFSASTADRILRDAVDRSFNCIRVEGHTSTSDTVLLLANGAACKEELSLPEIEQFHEALNDVALELAQMIIHDAEGADHFVTIHVNGCATRDDARIIAQTIADDALVKTAITGNDPNWGRIISACGRTSIRLTENDLTLTINDQLIFEQGKPADYDEQAISQSMATGDVVITLQLPFGKESITNWTSDLTQEYVRLNSEYTT